MNAIAALADGLIDYAGLFPPAALEMSAAVRQYAAYRRGPHAWALGRFIVPLARLGEMRQAAAPFAGAGDWKLSVLALPGEPLPPGIDSVEMKIERGEDIRRISEGLPALRYFEIPIAADPRDLVAALAETGGRAKVRTGGLTPEAYPGVAELARFLCACAAARVPFKATAGLHHPLAAPKGNPPSHGFVNLFLAAALAYQGSAHQEEEATLAERADACEDAAAAPACHGDAHEDVVAALAERGDACEDAAAAPAYHGYAHEDVAAAPAYQGGARPEVTATLAYQGHACQDVAATLEETSAEAFRWDADGVSWHGHRLSTGQIAAARAEFAIAFGSCSFDEPIAGLQALGWL